MIRYSVVIPIYNMELYLKECIDSVLKQKRNDIEIILVNDGSLDRSLDICNEFKEKNNNIIVVDKKNTGTTDTILKGIEKVSGEYICFIDADDKIANDFFSKLDIYVEKNFDIILFDFYRMFKNHIEEYKVNKVNYGKVNEKELKELQKFYFDNFEKYSLYRWDKVIKTEVVKKSISEIKKKTIYFEDHVISFLNLLNAESLCYIDENLYFYRMRKNSVSHRVNEKIFNDLDIIEDEMKRIAKNNNYDSKQMYELYLYFLYQYARNSLKSENIHDSRKVKLKDIFKCKSNNKKMVLLLYKLKLKRIYKFLLRIKKSKENASMEEYYE